MQAGRTSKAELVDNWCWAFASDEDRRYHDTEWGVPVHDDTHMFEHLSMECLQCGLSWNTILLKRPILRECFAGFDIDAVAAFGEQDIERILATPGMLRSERKVRAIVGNARAAQRLREEFGSFNAYFWGWTDGKTVLYEGHEKGGIPAVVYAHRSHRDPGGHLHSAEKGIHPVKDRACAGDADDRQRCGSCGRPSQMRSHSCGSDDNTETIFPGMQEELPCLLRRAVR